MITDPQNRIIKKVEDELKKRKQLTGIPIGRQLAQLGITDNVYQSWFPNRVSQSKMSLESYIKLYHGGLITFSDLFEVIEYVRTTIEPIDYTAFRKSHRKKSLKDNGVAKM